MKRLVCLMVAAAMLLGLAACVPTTQPNEPAATAVPGANETAQPGDSTETPAAEEVSDDYLIWNIGMEPKTWDPQLNTSGPGGLVIINLYDGLVRDTKEGIKMATAESYEVSANAEGVADTVYTFKLRDDAKWSDGQSVTANDFEYAWKRACSPEMASPYAFLITDYIKGAYEYFSGTGSRDDVGVKALDEHTLQVELIQPTAYFLNLVSFFTYMPCREDMASTGEGWEKDPAKCITNGAFYLEEYKIGSHVLLKKNENFWNKDNVKLAGVKGLFITDATTSLQGYEAGEINITSTLPGEEIPRLLAEDPNFASEPALGTTYIEFNMDAEIVNDVNVRKALSLAIDRKLICDQVLRNGAVPAAAFVAPPFKLSTGESLRAMDEFGNVMTEYEINPNGAEVEKAREYLAAAGYPNGEGFPTLELLYYESGSNSQIAEAVQQMWKENLGITVNLKVEEYAVFANTRSSGNYTLDITGWSADYNDPVTMLSLFSATGMNDSRWRYKEYAGVPDDTTLNPENKPYDDAIIMASKTMGTKRDGYLKEAEDVLMNNMVICPLYYTISTQVVDHSRVSGPGRTPIGMWDFRNFTMIGK
jgi:oligopeptide transport system substrate-binding protein